MPKSKTRKKKGVGIDAKRRGARARQRQREGLTAKELGELLDVIEEHETRYLAEADDATSTD